MESNTNRIGVIAICLFRRDDRILVVEYFDSVKNTPFYRPLGGAVEFGETTSQALIREIREEIGKEITDLRLLDILEHLFICEGKQGHEIVYVYDARFLDQAVYGKETLTVTEDGGVTLGATWRTLDSFNEYHRLVPENLISLLKDCK
jgi:8-oxo-dGTP pyrophosphatase MutT (NUDIX family)